MKIHHKQDYSAQMAAFTEKIRKEPNHEGAENLSNEKLELLKEFVNYLESDNHDKHKCKHGKGHHGKFEGRGHRFMFGHGFGKHGHGFGKHGHGFGKHGHGFGKHGHHGKHHHGFEKHLHGHGGHGKHGKHHGGRPYWTISHGETQAVIEIDADAPVACGTEVVTGTNIGQQVPHFKPHHRGFYGHWLKCKRNHCIADQSCQTEVRPEPQDTLATQVQNISIENSPPVEDLMKD